MSDILSTKKPIRCTWCKSGIERGIRIEGIGTLCLHHYRVAIKYNAFKMDAKVQGIHDVNFHERNKGRAA